MLLHKLELVVVNTMKCDTSVSKLLTFVSLLIYTSHVNSAKNKTRDHTDATMQNERKLQRGKIPNCSYTVDKDFGQKGVQWNFLLRG